MNDEPHTRRLAPDPVVLAILSHRRVQFLPWPRMGGGGGGRRRRGPRSPGSRACCHGAGWSDAVLIAAAYRAAFPAGRGAGGDGELALALQPSLERRLESDRAGRGFPQGGGDRLERAPGRFRGLWRAPAALPVAVGVAAAAKRSPPERCRLSHRPCRQSRLGCHPARADRPKRRAARALGAGAGHRRTARRAERRRWKISAAAPSAPTSPPCGMKPRRPGCFRS